VSGAVFPKLAVDIKPISDGFIMLIRSVAPLIIFATVPGSTHNCFNVPTTIDFSSVPEISKQIVSEEKPGQKQKQPTGEPPAAAPYTGPIFGASPRPGRTPVVGYTWSLE
jgi:hypothetical protein